MAWRRWVPDKRPTVVRAFLVGSAAAAVGVLLRLAMQPALGNDLPFITFFPALLCAAVWGGLGAGLVCLTLCCFAGIAFYLPQADLPHVVWAVLAFLVSGGLLSLVGSALAATTRQLQETQRRMEAAEADLRTLVGELAHRSRNGLTVVMGIIAQSARKGGTAQELAETVNARLGAMALAQDEVVRGGGTFAALDELLARTLSPFDLDRFVFEPSPRFEVTPETAAALALLTHELATNAVKHGALSSPSGQVHLTWKAAPGSVQVRWRERGGPPVPGPGREGFGTRLLNNALASQGGRAERRFEADGVVCEIEFPARRHPEVETPR
ncbi:MAG TPA: sensor histidine kinase [Caulobacter sp.]|nr:sensor histidine kinase [Caulobacter sp.]